ncbi:E3 ubiquitin-protein ligase [Plasmodium gonderi]|uniref:E3 ubiquitin-protein ligase CHIP n=1 Tax=Plasmodium gonderi TaxID=77519 RepID=A0A1Y1JDT0_PLAGO|nr:E3 ubiquitin-protein ligase [Plasmodium gonderi]GAW78912.1 E3 ubiquitin-protein ligase [Plasmodium gonderi]
MNSIAEIKRREKENFKNKYNKKKKNKKRFRNFNKFSNNRKVKKTLYNKSDKISENWDANTLKYKTFFFHKQIFKSLKRMDTNKAEEKKGFLKNWNINYLSNNLNAFMKSAESIVGGRTNFGTSSNCGAQNNVKGIRGNRCFPNVSDGKEKDYHENNNMNSNMSFSSNRSSNRNGNSNHTYLTSVKGANSEHIQGKQKFSPKAYKQEEQDPSPNMNNLHLHERVQANRKEVNYKDIRDVWEKIKNRNGLSNLMESANVDSATLDSACMVSKIYGDISDSYHINDLGCKDSWMNSTINRDVNQRSMGNIINLQRNNIIDCSSNHNKIKYDISDGVTCENYVKCNMSTSNNKTTGNSSSQNNGNNNSNNGGKGSNSKNSYNNKDSNGGTNSNNYNYSNSSGYNNNMSGYPNSRTQNGGSNDNNNSNGDRDDDDDNNGHYSRTGRCDNNGDTNEDEDDNEDNNEDEESDRNNNANNDGNDHNGKMYTKNNGSSSSGASFGSSASITSSSHVNPDEHASNRGMVKHQFQRKRKSGRNSCSGGNENSNIRNSNIRNGNSANSINYRGGETQGSNSCLDQNNSSVDFCNVGYSNVDYSNVNCCSVERRNNPIARNDNVNIGNKNNSGNNDCSNSSNCGDNNIGGNMNEYYNQYSVGKSRDNNSTHPLSGDHNQQSMELPIINRGNYDGCGTTCEGNYVDEDTENYRSNYNMSMGDRHWYGENPENNDFERISRRNSYSNNESTNNLDNNYNMNNNTMMSKNTGNKRNYVSNINYKDMSMNPSYHPSHGKGNNCITNNMNSFNSSGNFSKQIKKGRDCENGVDEGNDSDHNSAENGEDHSHNPSSNCHNSDNDYHQGNDVYGKCRNDKECNDKSLNDEHNQKNNVDVEEEVQKRHVHATNCDMLNPEDRKREAEKYKVLGNQSYKLGYFESAIDYYTKAISYDNTNHVYYTNRALCYKKQKLWKLANSDARQALNLEEESVKAHFILGLTLLHLNSLEEGLKKLTKAKTLSSYLKDSNESEINRYILQAKKLIYLRDEQNKQLTYTELQSFLIDKINLLNQIGYITNEEKYLRTQQTENLFKEILDSFQRKQIPDYLCCKISMCLMNEPVITPSGMTYDKIFLYEHVKHNGSFDPVSREQFSMREVIPNYAIKEATDNFLKSNPWAFEE